RSTGERVAIAVAKQTRAIRIAMFVLVLVSGGLAGAVAYKSSRDTAAGKAQMEQLIAANAELTQEFSKKLQADTALTRSLQARTDSLERIARNARGAQQVAAAAQLRLNQELQRRFTAMNPTALFAANESAIALITAQFGSQSSEATGFVATTSGLVVTNRHVVVDTGTGARASQVYIRLSNNSGTHRARIVRVSSDSLVDLAILQIEGAGPFPAVKNIASSVDAAVGGAVVTIGYPMGSDLPMEGTTPKPTLTMGVVGRTITDLLQIDSFASHGSSGSPVFDSHGHVVGVVWGGPSDTGGRIVYAVPADRINDLIKGGK
ncbi:MAG TPA: serine protease, partial [Gemmatimonadaceae bacterium]